ncbi:hypothetical protein CFB84_08390 [Burkholderia aenigmatica]|uniref:Uncharacterized protein n=1 Tax=Burkholderia aenigmatica TaxID=2015348 RepID=A0A228J2V0_9BURK|nr:hypothetical protein CFB84_08390 [Burkholderia aenigmatica]
MWRRSRPRRRLAPARSIERSGRAPSARPAVSRDAASPVIGRQRGAFLFHGSRLRASRGRTFDRRLFQSCHV